jgi:D-galactose 1-dehydrogenase/L-arabinose 1- dehydrogenase
VFDPAINALSILTAIVPEAVLVRSATMTIPDGRAAPIAATIAMELADGAPVTADLDFLQTGPQSWTIEIDADGGRLVLADGGARWTIEGVERHGEDREYHGLYGRFAALIADGQSDVDLSPLQLVADSYLVADLRRGAAFAF